MARDAQDFGYKVYYGDGTRADVLHAAGAHVARAVLVCIDDPAAATRVVERVKADFPHAAVLARARDREHALALVQAQADFQIRETFESAMQLGRASARVLGASEQDADELDQRLRRNDAERMALEFAGGSIYAARDRVRQQAAGVGVAR